MFGKKLQYILTWVTLGILLVAGLLLMILAWNGTISQSPSYLYMIICWILISVSGIYLFMLAVKKAHRLWIDEERRKKEEAEEVQRESKKMKSIHGDQQLFDFTATARRLVRRMPENTPLEKSGEELLRHLAREIEIMTGILYVKKRSLFEAVATYALASPDRPYSFREGEGLSGQVARNRQIMVVTKLPEDHLKVYSGLGKAMPAYLAIIPFIQKNRTIAILECSGYKYHPQEIESMFRIFSRELVEKLSLKLI
jgi:hypothetical protein